jgi:hypothetical protein
MCIDIWLTAVVNQKSQVEGLFSRRLETLSTYQYFCRTTGRVSQPVALKVSNKKEANKPEVVQSPVKC